ncbi:MAG: 30S ribosomal protein S8 [Vicinamibacterales bacterium]
MTDPIADMLTRIRNAVHARHARVDLPASKLKSEIAKILRTRATLRATRRWRRPRSVEQVPRQVIRVFLKYGPGGEKVISGIERVSRPGRRVYTDRDSVPPVLGGLGVNILTTSQGVMTGRAARKAGVGGEILCVW